MHRLPGLAQSLRLFYWFRIIRLGEASINDYMLAYRADFDPPCSP